jgi:hypothetical protein
MQTKFIEATDGTEFNWGKFAVCRFESEEWQRPSVIDPPRSLLRKIGWDRDQIFVLDLQTCEGANFRPGGLASADLEKHRIWVCPMFEPFLVWLYKQDLSNLNALPALVNLGAVPTALFGYRRKGPEVATGSPTQKATEEAT